MTYCKKYKGVGEIKMDEICSDCRHSTTMHDSDGCWHCLNCKKNGADCDCNETCICKNSISN